MQAKVLIFVASTRLFQALKLSNFQASCKICVSSRDNSKQASQGIGGKHGLQSKHDKSTQLKRLNRPPIPFHWTSVGRV